MAGILIYLASSLASKAHNSIQDNRSPLLPLPPTVDPTESLNERSLKASQRDWHHRYLILESKVRGLDVARRNGVPTCWAGDQSDRRKIAAARDEAQWVAGRLAEAVTWCREQGVKKPGYTAGFKKHSKKQPAHSSFPPSLIDLPLPLPEPLPLTNYTLTIKRPPVETAPAYAEEADEGNGETSLQIGPPPLISGRDETSG